VVQAIALKEQKIVKQHTVNIQNKNKAMYNNPSKKKMARQENKSIKKSEKAYGKMSKSTGLEFEPKVKKRNMKPLKKK
jgi:hypothetical protein